MLASTIEHHAVLDAVEWLATHEGARVTWLDVDSTGRVHPATLRAALEEDPESVALVTVMWANNEVGTIEPIGELAEIAHEYGVPFHTDAVQAVGPLAVDFAASGVDALTVASHKLGGPYGVGALLLRRDVPCTPLLHGGGQERDVRSGTLDVAGAVGPGGGCRPGRSPPRDAVGPAAVGCATGWSTACWRSSRTRSSTAHPTDRLPGIAHFSFPGCEGDSLLMLLDARGIECSTGSACSAGVAQPSHVLLAMGADPARARGSLRFSLGHTSTEADVDAVIDAIGPVVERARRAGLTSLAR